MDLAESGSLSILLIDDNPDDLAIIRRHLHDSDIGQLDIVVCSEFADAADAMEGVFDVCLLDYELGGYTALDLLRRVRAEHLAGPVILLTGHEQASVDQAALELGAADFMPKSGMNAAGLGRAIRYARRQFTDQRRLRFMARHDQLTGLLNRHTFIDELSNWLLSPLHRHEAVCVLYVDLDGFKAINDAWGHDVGDKALQHAADSLRRAVRKSDLVGRYGGDELIAAVGHVAGQNIDDVLAKVLEQLREPLMVEDQRIVVTASIGVTRASQAPESANELVRLADHAMFAAKQAGRDTWSFYNTDTPRLPRKRAALEGDLRQALADNLLTLQFESHVDMCTGNIVGAEALSRWHDARRGTVSPAVFVRLATDGGLLRPFGQWAMEAALAALASWESVLPPGFRLSVNVAPAQLLDDGFPEHVAAALHRHQIDGQALRLEITEDALLAERGNTGARLRALQDMGVSLALDDFGTGHSSLSQIAQLPIDTLKIDTSFVTAMATNPRSAALVRAIISLGEDLGLTVIAEGVETEASAQQLISDGCRVAQGFLYPRGPIDVFGEALGAQQARRQ